MRQIVYFSTASGRQDAIVTAGILAVARVHNRREGVTGLLVAGGHRYLQVIEGSSPVIDALITRIRRD
ncbi:MAG: BLUF domain-containing protein, partial [Sphingomonas bacterium]|nr:BLUF domain-containing protein [Sphingomonas bacterium]